MLWWFYLPTSYEELRGSRDHSYADRWVVLPIAPFSLSSSADGSVSTMPTMPPRGRRTTSSPSGARGSGFHDASDDDEYASDASDNAVDHHRSIGFIGVDTSVICDRAFLFKYF